MGAILSDCGKYRVRVELKRHGKDTRLRTAGNSSSSSRRRAQRHDLYCGTKAGGKMNTQARTISERLDALREALKSWRRAKPGGGGVSLAIAVEEFLASSPAPEPVAQDGWVLVSDPDVKAGDMSHFIVTVERASGKRYAFGAYFANRYECDWNPDGVDADEVGDGYSIASCGEDSLPKISGWFDCKQHHDFDDWYQPLLSTGDRVVAWMNYPAPLSASPSPPQARTGKVDEREKTARAVYTCILRGLNDLMVSSSAQAHVSGWLQCWAQKMRSAGFEPDGKGRDIDRALMVLAAPPEDIK